ncbi:hypothetical protein SAZ10_21085 [Mesorhizobium sp. BAC0120]|uniref:hypothetical protein n=1 Tax=Mesorhizobium sp. BAC0120 TaxID=3090670 RepID=UPI00298C3BDF|nr:hypothetical protein [Mesorhizobium sp. BAC0120]MDW6024248.1 hypothetical protein [Mesorhizobium sp. BAC0120]
MFGEARLFAWLAVLTLSALPANADPLTAMDQVGKAILACWKPPAGITKSSVTLSFSFNRDGSLIGPPQPTAIDVTGDENAHKQFIAAAINAVDQCTPVEFAPALAQGIGGQPFTMDFTTADRNPAITSDN